MEEIEITYINIDEAKIKEKLLELGAKKVGDYYYRRIVFDYPDFRLDKKAAWIRLRDEGDKITLTFKQRLGKDVLNNLDGDEGMNEYETEVKDFDTTRKILLEIGLTEKMYQENKRTRYIIDDVECDIDTWPLLDPYLEIEGPNWDKVYEIAEKLGLKRENGKKYSTNQIYRLKGIDDRNYTKLTFSEQIKRTKDKF